jgi:hypothetical protein
MLKYGITMLTPNEKLNYFAKEYSAFTENDTERYGPCVGAVHGLLAFHQSRTTN